MTLYRVSDASGSLQVDEVGQKPLQQAMLKTEVLIIYFQNGIVGLCLTLLSLLAYTNQLCVFITKMLLKNVACLTKNQFTCLHNVMYRRMMKEKIR